MSPTLSSRFLDAEEQFLSAFTSGPKSLSAFTQAWAFLVQDYTAAANSQQVDSHVVSLAQATTSRISILADSLIAVDSEANRIRETLDAKIDLALSQEDFSDPADSGHHAHLSVDKLAYPWLIENLHDPYPPISVKSDIAQRCGCEVKEVQDWFIDARRQIGWTALCSEKFHGSRRAICEAALRVHHGESGLPADIQGAFAVIQMNSHGLRPQSLTSATEINTEDKRESCAEREVGNSIPCVVVDDDTSKAVLLPTTPPHDGHPLTCSSVVSGYSPTLLDEEEDVTPPPPIAGRKRRFDHWVDCIDDPLQVLSLSDSVVPRPLKRHRFNQDIPSQTSSSDNSSPHSSRSPSVSPGAFTDAVPRAEFATSQSFPVLHCDTTNHNSVVLQKRRFSDSGPSSSPKRPRCLPPTPCTQVVSNPLPINLEVGGVEDVGSVAWDPSHLIAKLADSDDLGRSVFSCTTEECTASGADVLVSPVTEPILPGLQIDLPVCDLFSATMAGFDFSQWHLTDPPVLGRDFGHSFDYTSSEDSSASSPSMSSLSDLGSQDELADVDWGQFVNILDSLEQAPSSTPSSHISDPSSPSSQNVLDISSSSSRDDTMHAGFGMDPSFTSVDFLADIGLLTSLPLPLDAVF